MTNVTVKLTLVLYSHWTTCKTGSSLYLWYILSTITRMKDNMLSLKRHRESQGSACVLFADGHNLKWSAVSGICIKKKIKDSVSKFEIWHQRLL